jgi:hypothetical protein
VLQVVYSKELSNGNFVSKYEENNVTQKKAKMAKKRYESFFVQKKLSNSAALSANKEVNLA